jgi:dihydropteroate synthase
MGVINCTPDSFYTGSRATTQDQAKKMVEKMVNEGADIIDIGGRSSRPGSVEISDEEEIERVSEVISFIVKAFSSTWISIDTTKSTVAKYAVSLGCKIINDISGGEMDKDMISTVSNLNVPFICMHMQGTPEHMQNNPHYENVTEDVSTYFESKLDLLKTNGIKNVVIDPGFGFGKSIEHNYTLMRDLKQFKKFEKPILVGISRKSMIYKLLGVTPEESLNGTNALNMYALMNGANILRVHDVKAAKEVVNIYQQLYK